LDGAAASGCYTKHGLAPRRSCRTRPTQWIRQRASAGPRGADGSHSDGDKPERRWSITGSRGEVRMAWEWMDRMDGVVASHPCDAPPAGCRSGAGTRRAPRPAATGRLGGPARRGCWGEAWGRGLHQLVPGMRHDRPGCVPVPVPGPGQRGGSKLGADLGGCVLGQEASRRRATPSTAATLHSRVATEHLGSRHASIICSRVDEPWMTTARSTKASGGGA